MANFRRLRGLLRQGMPILKLCSKVRGCSGCSISLWFFVRFCIFFYFSTCVLFSVIGAILIDDDDDDDDDAMFCVFLAECARGRLHDKLAQYAFILLPARRRPQGLVIISVCLSVRTVFVRKISQERVHGSPPNLVGGSRG